MIFSSLLICLAAIVGVVTSTITGQGMLMFLVPVLLAYLPPTTAIVTALLIGLTMSLLILFGEQRKHKFSWKIVLAVYIASLPGLLLGAFILTNVEKELLQIILGSVIITAAMLQYFFASHPTRKLKVNFWTFVTGLVAGTMNSLTSMAGPALGLWLKSHKASPDQIRDTLSALFILLNSTSVIIICTMQHGSIFPTPIMIVGLLAPIMIVTHYVSRKLYRRLATKYFRLATLLVIVAAGIASILAGMSKL